MSAGAGAWNFFAGWVGQRAEAEKAANAQRRVVAAVALPYTSDASYQPFPTSVDVDVARLCEFATLHRGSADQLAATSVKRANSAFTDLCSAASVTNICASLRTQIPTNWSNELAVAFAKLPQRDDYMFTVLDKHAAARVALYCLQVARNTLDKGGLLFGTAIPSISLDEFPSATFSLHGAPTVPPPALAQSNAPTPSTGDDVRLLKRQLAEMQQRLDGSTSWSNPPAHDSSEAVERAVKAQRSHLDQQKWERASSLGAFDSRGELDYESVELCDSQPRMPAKYAREMLEGRFDMPFAAVSKHIRKEAHGLLAATATREEGVMEVKYKDDTQDPGNHVHLEWAAWQDIWRRFAATWLDRFGNASQESALPRYEEALRKVNMKWRDRPTAAAEVDKHYREVMARGVRGNGTIALAPDKSRALPSWKLTDTIVMKVLGFPGQERLPFCTLCASNHLAGGECSYVQPATKAGSLGKTPPVAGNPRTAVSKTELACFRHNKEGCNKTDAACRFMHHCALCKSTDHIATACDQPGGGPGWGHPAEPAPPKDP